MVTHTDVCYHTHMNATRELLTELLDRNSASVGQVVSAIFTVTPDLTSEFPARAARDLGWTDTAMLCSVEIPVPGGSVTRLNTSVTLSITPANT